MTGPLDLLVVLMNEKGCEAGDGLGVTATGQTYVFRSNLVTVSQGLTRSVGSK